MTKHTILFLAANPSGTDERALDREAHSIRAELKRSGYRDRFEFETRWAAEPLDLLRELRELKPTVVHFSGHGDQSGLFFQTAGGRAQVVSPAAIAETFGAAGASVKLVVLSACYSEAPAEALLAHVDCVVGIGGALHDDAARSFAIGFYGALGEYESVARTAIASSFNATKLAWQPIAARDAPSGRFGAHAVAWRDRVVIAGGYVDNNQPASGVAVLDLPTNRWRAAPLPASLGVTLAPYSIIGTTGRFLAALPERCPVRYSI